MATMYVSWHKYPTKVVGETTMQTEGDFIISQAVNIATSGATNEAPAEAQYAEVWADVPFYFVAGPTAAKDKTSKPYPANTPTQIPNIYSFGTVIAGIAI